MSRRTTRPGGRRRKAWRLKKKHAKWFCHVTQELIMETLSTLPKQYLETAWNALTYDICRFYK